jgi:hypothetical protein
MKDTNRTRQELRKRSDRDKFERKQHYELKERKEFES